jgi:1-acyl-sn-glycerol-3-phosphate acyltransferase
METSDFVYKTLLRTLGPIFGSLYDVKTYGKENLPDGRAVLVANHTSYLDPFFMIAGINSKKPIHFCTLDFYKYSSSRFGKVQASIVNFLLGLTGQIVFDGGKINKAAFRKIKMVLEDERYLGVFAEGKRSHNGKLNEFKDGASYIALKTQSPLVPIWLNGSYEIWKRGDYFPKLDGRVEMIIGNPIVTNSSGNGNLRKDVADLSDFVRQEILKLSTLSIKSGP